MTIPRITLRIYDDIGRLSRELHFQQDVIKVGRNLSNDLCLGDGKVSRMHSIIEVVDRDFFIVDLGSWSGVIVNGLKVTSCKLVGGDEILLGDTRVEVCLGTEET